MSGSRDVDLLKIQVLGDYYQAQFNYIASIASGVVVGLLLADVGFYFVLGYIVFYIFLAVIIASVFWYSIIISNGYHLDLEKIDSLIIRVQNGETLESITELRRRFQREHRSSITQMLFTRS